MPNKLRRRNIGADGHWYQLDGEYCPGVTTILGIGLGIKFDIPSQWAARIVAEYVAENRDWLVQAPNDRTMVDILKAVPRNTTTDAQVKGTTIHGYGQTLHDTGEVQLDIDHNHLMPYVQAHAEFLDRWEIETVASEVPLANTAARYAGTSDLLARSRPITRLYNQWLEQDGQPPIPDDAIGILDLKTGKDIRDKDKVQVEAYSRCDLCHIGGAEQPMPRIDWVGLVHNRADEAELHLIRPAYRDRLARLFTAAHFEWHALDEKRGWIQHADAVPDHPELVEGAA